MMYNWKKSLIYLLIASFRINLCLHRSSTYRIKPTTCDLSWSKITPAANCLRNIVYVTEQKRNYLSLMSADSASWIIAPPGTFQLTRRKPVKHFACLIISPGAKKGAICVDRLYPPRKKKQRIGVHTDIN